MRGFYNTPYMDDGTFTLPPAKVLGLTALVISGSEIDLNWSDAAGANGYRVFRNGVLISSPTPSFLNDLTVSPGTTYTYTVAALNPHGQGQISNSVTVTTAPAQVIGLTATTRSASQIDLLWNSVVGATSYTITRNGPIIKTGQVPASYSDTGLSANTSYTYTVAAVGVGGTGLESSPANAVTSGVVTGAISPVGGHWIYIDQGVSKDSQFARTQQLVAQMGSDIVGFQYLWKWADYESPTTPGDYSGNWAAAGQAGFQLVHRFADYLRSVGKKMHMNNFSYGGNGGDASTVGDIDPVTGKPKPPIVDPRFFLSDQMPTYLSGSTYGPNTASVDGIFGGLWMESFRQSYTRVRSFMRYWDPAVKARLFELSRAYGQEFDSHAGLGMFSPLSESTVPSQMATYSLGADKGFYVAANPNGAFVQMRAHWPTTALRFWGNFIGSRQDMSDMQNALVASKWMCAGPDLLNDFTDQVYPAWNSSTNYVFTNTVSRSGQNYFCLTANTNSPPSLNQSGTSANPNWEALGMGTRNVDSDWVWMGKDSNNVVNPNYTNWVNRGAFGHDVEPLDLDASHDDAVIGTHIAHANRTGAMSLFWYDLRYNSTPNQPQRNRTDTPHPNLLDQISSCARGGVPVNGITIPKLINQNVYPPTW